MHRLDLISVIVARPESFPTGRIFTQAHPPIGVTVKMTDMFSFAHCLRRLAANFDLTTAFRCRLVEQIPAGPLRQSSPCGFTAAGSRYAQSVAAAKASFPRLLGRGAKKPAVVAGDVVKDASRSRPLAAFSLTRYMATGDV